MGQPTLICPQRRNGCAKAASSPFIRAGPLEGNPGFAAPIARAGLLLNALALLRPSAARLTVLTAGCGRA